MPIGKRKIRLSIDHQPTNPFGVAGGDAGIAGGVDLAAPPVPPTIPAPVLLSLTPSLLQSAVTPSAQIAAVWSGLETNDQETYRVQVASDSGFVALVGTWSTGQNQSDAVIQPLKCNTTYYVRVQTIVGNSVSDWSNVLSDTTPADTTPPAAPTGQAASFINAGDLVVIWANPTSANFRDVEIGIYSDNTKTTQYALIYDATGRHVWTAAENLAATSQLGDATLYVELRSRSWGNVFSSAVNASATKARPATPASLTTSWAGDTGAAGADCIITWDTATDANRYVVTIDGVSRTVFGNKLVYTFDQNGAEHSGVPDPVLSITVAAYDAINQANAVSATATATNAAPATTSATLFGGFSTVGISITASPAADLNDYTIRIIKDGVTAATYHTGSLDQIYSATASGSYQVGVIVRDLFGQSSSETVSGAVVLDALSIADLRAESAYTDSLGTAAATLKAAMADDLKTSGGVSYASNASWVRWIQEVRPLLDRYKTVTLSMTPSSGTSNWYIRTSADGTTWRYFAGPIVGTRTLTEVANAAAAQAAPVSAASLGGQTTSRVDLPAIAEARYVEVWLRNTAASTRVDEFYPRRLVQGDDVEAESLTAIHIAAGSITADRLSVSQLSAITADMGSITAGTITGGTVQTATSGARVVLSSAANGGIIGYGSSDTYDPAAGTGTYQILWKKTDGKFYFGAGAGFLDSNGISVAGGSSGQNKYKVTDATGATEYAALSATRVSSKDTGFLIVGGNGNTSAELDLRIENNASGNQVWLKLTNFSSSGYDGTSSAWVELKSLGDVFVRFAAANKFKLVAEGSSTVLFSVNNAGDAVASGDGTFLGGLNVGSVSGATAGQIVGSGALFSIFDDAATNTTSSNIWLYHRTSATPAAGFGVDYNVIADTNGANDRNLALTRAVWATATDASRKGRVTHFVYDNVGARTALILGTNGSAPMIGFLGATEIARPTITGSRGGNAALASLLTQLANLGLITDSSTA